MNSVTVYITFFSSLSIRFLSSGGTVPVPVVRLFFLHIRAALFYTLIRLCFRGCLLGKKEPDLAVSIISC